MKSFKYILILLFLVSGCASYTPKQMMEKEVQSIELNYQSKDQDRYYFLINSAASDAVRYSTAGSEPQLVLKSYLKSSGKMERYWEVFSRKIDEINKISDYEHMLGVLSNFEKLDLISTGDKQSYVDKIKQYVFSDNLILKSKLNITYTDLIASEAFLQDNASQNQILLRSVNSIKENADSMSVEGFVKLAEKTANLKKVDVEKYNEISKLLLSSVKKLTLAKALDPYYPGLFASFDSKTKLRIAVDLKGMDRITSIDFISKLKTSYPEVDWVEQGLKPSSKTFPQISIERARWADVSTPTQSKTITLDRASVDFAQALLFMPDYSTYNYEIQQSGFSIDYGFVLLYLDSVNSEPVEKVVRGVAESKTTVCVNQRIINAFGGVKQADFIANNEMRRTCGVQGISKSDAISAILSEVKNEVRSYDRIKETIIARQ